MIRILTTPVFGASWIVPGVVWTDTDGVKIDAHGGGIFQHENTFYWVGQGDGDNVTARMYSSTDLLNWENRGLQSTVGGMWRPKLAKLEGGFRKLDMEIALQYALDEGCWRIMVILVLILMSLQIYGQVSRHVQPLESTQIVGGYTITQPAVYLPPNNYSYSDTGIFRDDDGTWYLLTSADHNTLQVNQIHTNGTIGARINSLTGAPYEAPGMIKVDGIYFLIVSGKTAYAPNPNKMFWTTSINGTWTGPFDIAPNTTNTYDSQNSFELAVEGSECTTYVYMGDQFDATGSEESNYVWLPMAINSSAKTLTLEYHSMWKVNVSTGIVSFPTVAKRHEAEHAELSGRAVGADCEHCVSKRAVYGNCNWLVSRHSTVTFHNVTGTGSPQWMSFQYTVSNPKVANLDYTTQSTNTLPPPHPAGETYISINNHSVLKLSSLNSRAGYAKIVPVEVTLNRGDGNVVEFGAVGDEDFEVEIECLEVYEEES
ncbi:glycosyl hydrolase family 43 protein [Rutstroemia sp. NJR-2017a BVV2]|nr:glycosyl hydrolase family 43 protein [Rutstroemia sp. NJR-2017a BVV2]